MNASKTLIAAIAAATVIGTVGFVSAQTANEPAVQSAEPVTNPQGMQRPSAGPDTSAATSNTPADMSSPPYVAPASDAPAADTAAAPTAGNTAPANAEPQPKADRN